MRISTTLKFSIFLILSAPHTFASSATHSKMIEVNASNNELVVTFEELSEKQFMEFDQVIGSIPGIKLGGYCQKLKCYYFNYDNSIFKSEDEAFEALSIATKNYKPLLKLGTTSELVKQICMQ